MSILDHVLLILERLWSLTRVVDLGGLLLRGDLPFGVAFGFFATRGEGKRCGVGGFALTSFSNVDFSISIFGFPLFCGDLSFLLQNFWWWDEKIDKEKLGVLVCDYFGVGSFLLSASGLWRFSAAFLTSLASPPTGGVLLPTAILLSSW